MLESIKSVVCSRQFLIGTAVGATSGVGVGYLVGRRRVTKELEGLKKTAQEFKEEIEKDAEPAPASEVPDA